MAGRWTFGVLVLAIVAVLRALSRFSVDSRSTVFLAPPSSSTAQAAGATIRQTPRFAAPGAETLSTPTAVSFGAAFAAAAVLCAASRGGSARDASKTKLGVTSDLRDWEPVVKHHGMIQKVWLRKPFIPGEGQYSTSTPPSMPNPPPPRMSLSTVEEAVARYSPSDFYKVPFVKLDPASVKEVSKPSDLPKYTKPKPGIRFEKEPGFKRPPTGTDEYEAYQATLANMEESMDGNLSDKDIETDNKVLVTLLRFLDEQVKLRLASHGFKRLPVDLIKVSKKPGSKTLVMEQLFKDNDMTAEWRPYRGVWKRSEVSNHGDFMPAWHRAATGGVKDRNMMVTGLWQVRGGRDTMPKPSYKVSDIDLDGVSISARAKVHADSEGKTVQLRHKNWYFRQDLTVIDSYMMLLLGGADILSIALHRSGKLINVLELTHAQLSEGRPEMLEAVERRIGRLAALLKRIKEDVEKGGEGPFILQMQSGELVLGKYERPLEVEEEGEEELSDVELDVA